MNVKVVKKITFPIGKISFYIFSGIYELGKNRISSTDLMLFTVSEHPSFKEKIGCFTIVNGQYVIFPKFGERTGNGRHRVDRFDVADLKALSCQISS